MGNLPFEKYIDDYIATVTEHTLGGGVLDDVRDLRKTIRAIGLRCGFSAEKTEARIRAATQEGRFIASVRNKN